MNRRQRGSDGEAIAARWLEQRGYEILARNVNFRAGELDLIASDGDQIVFVEVRSRETSTGPRGADTVTFPKQRKLTRAALLWLQREGLRRVSARFDVVGVDLAQRSVCTHIRGAFDAR